MARPSYGPHAKQQAARLLEALLMYANDDLEHCGGLKIECNWQTETQLVVKTTIRGLAVLTARVFSDRKLTTEQIKEALKRYEDFLRILQDHRTKTQGAEEWHFTLKLWHNRWATEANLQHFDDEWDRCHAQKSSQAIDLPSPHSQGVGSRITTTTERTPSEAMNPSWGEAIDVSRFHGRTGELITLRHWMIHDRCRLVALVGMGGIGKTALSVKLAEQVQDQFQCIVWRSLRNAPSIQSLLIDVLSCLSDPQAIERSDSLDQTISRLLEILRSTRCLLILDNMESVLCSDHRAGAYREGYEGYEQLLCAIADTVHQSCLLLTSREKPRAVSLKEGKHLPIRSLKLIGLSQTEGREILLEKGFSLSEAETAVLVNRYSGNPLALKMVATTIQDLFDGNITEFLAQGASVFGDIFDLLDQQFHRLSQTEQTVMHWLAINRDWVSLAILEADLLPPTSKRWLLEALESLQSRSLIEKNASYFTQQPVVMEYVTQRLIERISEELIAEEIDQFDRYALMKAEAKDYIKTAQICLILQPIAATLLAMFRDKTGIAHCFNQVLSTLRSNGSRKPGYAGGNLLNLAWQLGIDLSGYDFSNLTLWQADLQKMTLRRTNFAGTDLAKSALTQMVGTLFSGAFSPNNRLLATGVDSDISLWQIGDARQLMRLSGHSSWVQSIAFSPDGQLLASGSNDQTIRLWDVQTGQCLKTLSGHSSWVQSIAFSPDGQLLASGSNDQTIRLWNAQTGQCCQVLQGHQGRLLSVVFCLDYSTLISSSEDGTVRLWNVQTGRCLRSFNIQVNWSLALAITPDGQTFVTGNDGNAVTFWDVQTGERLHTLPDYNSQVWSVSFSPDGRTLATASEDQSVKLWDVATGTCLKSLPDHRHRVWLVLFSPDGQTLVSASEDQTIRLWEVATGHCLSALTTHNNWIASIAFSPDGRWLASGSYDQRVRLWEVSTGACRQTLNGHTNLVASVAFAPIRTNIDGSKTAWNQGAPGTDSAAPAMDLTEFLLVSASDDQTLKLWNYRTGECVHTIRGHQSWVTSVSFSPDRRLLISGSRDQTLKVWDYRTGECLRTLVGHTHRVKAIALNPQGTIIASASDDQTVKLWDITTGACLRTLQGHCDWVVAVAFSACGRWVASGSGDHTIRIWRIDSGECVQTLQGHTHRVRSIAFNPVNSLLASSSDDQTVRLWDSETGRLLNILEGHQGTVWSVVFHPDGQRLASGGKDETIRLWDVKTGQCLKTLRIEKPYEGMNIKDARGLTVAQKATLHALGAVEVDC